MSRPRVQIYTDGACSGNPGPGGWAALLRYRDSERWLNGRADLMEALWPVTFRIQLSLACPIRRWAGYR